MINSVTVTNHLGQSVTIELRSPEKSGFLITDISGLNPPKADINQTSLANTDGSFFNSARASSRNIVISILFLEKPTIEDVRQKCYKFFPLKKKISLLIETDNRLVIAEGRVESNEIPIFSNREGATISVVCESSYLFAKDDLTINFGFLSPLFEFPFSNESTTLPLLEFGDISIETEKNIYYEGDADVGLVMHLYASGSVNDVVITKNTTGETISIDSAALIALTGSDIVSGDEIIISTVTGDKYAILIRGGNTINIFNTLGQNPNWFRLESGDNLFSYSADSGIANLSFVINSKIAYEGI